MGTNINIQYPADVIGIPTVSDIPAGSDVATDVYETDSFTISVPTSRLLNSGVSSRPLEYTVRPEFNYLSTFFNNKFNTVNEKAMPTPYSEIYQTNEDLEDAYSTAGFNLIQGGNIDSESEYGLTNPRLIFLGKAGSIKSRLPEYLDEFENIIIVDANQNAFATKIAKHFPQYVEIKLSGTSMLPMAPVQDAAQPGGVLHSCITTEGALYHLITSFVIFNHNTRNTDAVDYGYDEIPVTFLNGEAITFTSQAETKEQFFLRSWIFYDSDEGIFQLSNPNPDYFELTTPIPSADNPIEMIREADYDCINPVSSDAMNADRDNIHATIQAKINEIADNPQFVDQTELLFFKIEKHDDVGLIQTFWTTVYSTTGSGFDFIDTQVKVGKEYTYRCYGYFLHCPNSNQARLTEVPLFEQNFKIEQPSLPRPQIQFVNVKDSDNKIRIFLNQSANPEDMEFYGLNQGEKSEFISRHNMYDITQEKKRFVYETDVGRYEVYKMLHQPLMGETSDPYSNIVSNSTLYEVTGTFGSTAAYFEDTNIKPFKKYYYIFRNFNAYGYYSNPSNIYEVELTKDADETFLNVNIVGFADPNLDKYLLSKTMMRLMQIVPSPNQTVFNPQLDAENNTTPLTNTDGFQIYGFRNGSDIVELGYYDTNGNLIYTVDTSLLYDGEDFATYAATNGAQGLETTVQVESLQPFVQNQNLPSLGVANEKIWTTKDSDGNVIDEGKRFKIRLVSKDSGRKIDFNLKFILNKNYNTNGSN